MTATLNSRVKASRRAANATMIVEVTTNFLRLPLRSEIAPPTTAVSIVPNAYSAIRMVCFCPASSEENPRWSCR